MSLRLSVCGEEVFIPPSVAVPLLHYCTPDPLLCFGSHDFLTVPTLLSTAEVHAEASALTTRRDKGEHEMRMITPCWKSYRVVGQRVVQTYSGKDRLKLTDVVANPDLPTRADCRRRRTAPTGQQSLSLNTCWPSWGRRGWRVVPAVIGDGWGRLESNRIDIKSSFGRSSSSRRRRRASA